MASNNGNVAIQSPLGVFLGRMNFHWDAWTGKSEDFFSYDQKIFKSRLTSVLQNNFNHEIAARLTTCELVWGAFGDFLTRLRPSPVIVILAGQESSADFEELLCCCWPTLLSPSIVELSCSTLAAKLGFPGGMAHWVIWTGGRSLFNLRSFGSLELVAGVFKMGRFEMDDEQLRGFAREEGRITFLFVEFYLDCFVKSSTVSRRYMQFAKCSWKYQTLYCSVSLW